jgi:hypothetical protein
MMVTAVSAQTVGQLIDQIQPWSTGGDATAREDLRQMTVDVMAPPVDEAARTAHEQALLTGLEEKTHVDVRTLLMEELGWVGTGEAVVALKEYLTDNNLVDPSAMAIYQICRQTGWDACYATSIEVLNDGISPDLKISMLEGKKIRIQAAGANHKVTVSDIQGKTIWSQGGSEAVQYDVPMSLFKVGVYAVTMKSDKGSITKRIALY